MPAPLAAAAADSAAFALSDSSFWRSCKHQKEDHTAVNDVALMEVRQRLTKAAGASSNVSACFRAAAPAGLHQCYRSPPLLKCAAV
jgi:hypothetical protein